MSTMIYDPSSFPIDGDRIRSDVDYAEHLSFIDVGTVLQARAYIVSDGRKVLNQSTTFDKE